jgi:hypothetical protein
MITHGLLIMARFVTEQNGGASNRRPWQGHEKMILPLDAGTRFALFPAAGVVSRSLHRGLS